MGGTYWSVSLPVHGPPATGWYHQKSTIGDQFRQHNLYHRRPQVARAPSPSTGRPCTVAARTRGLHINDIEALIADFQIPKIYPQIVC
ncbi:hypothetical protein BHM03_00003751 [Ensete ventricosum]|nr:hypothetical protein BHM03_00003751 [Ensete ventricosum]